MKSKNRNKPNQEEPLQSLIPYWRNLDTISQYQKDISENVKGAFWWADWYEKFLPLAPSNLWQDILQGWSFSVFQFTKEIRGNPKVEAKILTEVAGYGSQLGTVEDFLEVLAQHSQLNEKALSEEELFKVLKFRDLVRKVKKARGTPETRTNI
jgi:hypothetical protein